MVHFNPTIQALLLDIVAKLDEFSHIRMSQVMVSSSRRRCRGRSGLVAYVLPLKYRHGSPVEVRQIRQQRYHYAMLPLYEDGSEVLYIVYFMLPRFLNLTWDQKVETVIHELFHIDPQFNGDLRQFGGRNRLHGSMKAYDDTVKRLTRKYYEVRGDRGPDSFLRHNHATLIRKFGEVSSYHISEPRPKLLKVTPVFEPLEYEFQLPPS